MASYSGGGRGIRMHGARVAAPEGHGRRGAIKSERRAKVSWRRPGPASMAACSDDAEFRVLDAVTDGSMMPNISY